MQRAQRQARAAVGIMRGYRFFPELYRGPHSFLHTLATCSPTEW
jgi:hypothetical protein